MRKPKFQRHPSAVANEEYFSGYGKSSLKSVTLGTQNPDYYLKNRLDSAFQAGWNAAEKHIANKRPSDIKRVVKRIADLLMMDGNGNRAERLQLRDANERDLGGNCRKAVELAIRTVLTEESKL